MARIAYRACVDSARLKQQKSKPLLDALKKLGLEGWPGHGGKVSLDTLLIHMHKDYAATPFWTVYIWHDAADSRHMMKLHPSSSHGGHKDNKNDRENSLKIAEMLAKDNGGKPAEAEVKKAMDGIIEFANKLHTIPSSGGHDNGAAHDAMHGPPAVVEMSIADLASKYHIINWLAYFKAIVPPHIATTITDKTQIVVERPDYFKAVADLIKKSDANTVAAYAGWHLVSSVLFTLDDRYERNQLIAFALPPRGTMGLPRYHNCIIYAIVGPLENATEAIYLDRIFPPQARAEVDNMISNMKSAFIARIQSYNWLEATLRNQALTRVQQMRVQFDYPLIRSAALLDEYYRELTIQPQDSWFDIYTKLDIFFQHKMFTKLMVGYVKPELRPNLSPIRVLEHNSFHGEYHCASNTLVIPAGILVPPHYHVHYPKAINYGVAADLIGEWMFDPKCLWETPGVKIPNDHLGPRCILMLTPPEKGAKQEFGLSTNARLWLANKASVESFEGFDVSLEAYRMFMASRSQDMRQLPGIHHTAEQLYFIGYSIRYCEDSSDEALREGERNLLNRRLAYFSQFAQAFNCPKGTYMSPSERVSWMALNTTCAAQES